MKLLADTHTLLWAIGAPDRLGGRARKALAEPGNQVSFSIVSLWEIAIKMSLGRLELSADWRDLINVGRQRLHAGWLSLEPEHCHEVATLPWHHRDPFDRILVAQAITEGMTLVSRDRRMRYYAADVLWQKTEFVGHPTLIPAPCRAKLFRLFAERVDLIHPLIRSTPTATHETTPPR